MKNLVSIFKYDDYRLYLNDLFNKNKKTNKNFSLRQFSTQIGLSSHSTLSHVIHGKRKLTNSTLNKILCGIKLSDNEEMYFRILIQYTHSKNINEKRTLFEQLNSIREKTKYYKAKKEQYRYFENWFIPALREVVAHSKWNNDYKQLSNFFITPISINDIKKSIKFLFEKKLLKKTGEKIQQTENMILPGEIPYFFIKRARDQMIDISKEMLDIVKKEERYYLNYTFSIGEKKLNNYISIIKEMEDKIENLIINENDSDLDKVYQFNLQFFPLTKSFKNED